MEFFLFLLSLSLPLLSFSLFRDTYSRDVALKLFSHTTKTSPASSVARVTCASFSSDTALLLFAWQDGKGNSRDALLFYFNSLHIFPFHFSRSYRHVKETFALVAHRLSSTSRLDSFLVRLCEYCMCAYMYVLTKSQSAPFSFYRDVSEAVWDLLMRYLGLKR